MVRVMAAELVGTEIGEEREERMVLGTKRRAAKVVREMVRTT